jgi:hypothetical protein
MSNHVLEHIGFFGVYLTDPPIVVTFTTDDGVIGTFGLFCYNDRELADFVQFRAAVLLGCGRFDDRLESVRAIVEYGDKTQTLNYERDKFSYAFGKIKR